MLSPDLCWERSQFRRWYVGAVVRLQTRAPSVRVPLLLQAARKQDHLSDQSLELQVQNSLCHAGIGGRERNSLCHAGVGGTKVPVLHAQTPTEQPGTASPEAPCCDAYASFSLC